MARHGDVPRRHSSVTTCRAGASRSELPIEGGRARIGLEPLQKTGVAESRDTDLANMCDDRGY
jgi:hypothetical protein